MNKVGRKAAVAAYKERKVEAGAYVVRFTASGQAWVGSAPDLATIGSRIWFSLRQGGNPFCTCERPIVDTVPDAPAGPDAAPGPDSRAMLMRGVGWMRAVARRHGSDACIG